MLLWLRSWLSTLREGGLQAAAQCPAVEEVLSQSLLRDWLCMRSQSAECESASHALALESARLQPCRWPPRETRPQPGWESPCTPSSRAAWSGTCATALSWSWTGCAPATCPSSAFKTGAALHSLGAVHCLAAVVKNGGPGRSLQGLSCDLGLVLLILLGRKVHA